MDYSLIKLAEKFSEKYELTDEERDLLLRIDISTYHVMPLKGLRPSEMDVVDSLVRKDMIRYVSPDRNPMIPEGYTTTTTGSYALGTFDNL